MCIQCENYGGGVWRFGWKHLHGPALHSISQRYYSLNGVEKIIMDRPSMRFLGNTRYNIMLNVAWADQRGRS